jgi:hypothetical protein
MAEWHWYCDTHGQIDRSVEIRQRAGKSAGRCGHCGGKAVWAERGAIAHPENDGQLPLFGEWS